MAENVLFFKQRLKTQKNFVRQLEDFNEEVLVD